MFIGKLQQALGNIRNERPHCIFFTGALDCKSSQWWAEDIDSPEGAALDEIMEINGLYQLIDEPTNIGNGGMSCIDLIINMFVEYDAYPPMDSHCQH